MTTCKLPILKETLQHFVLYETKSTFYLIASNRSETRFKLLKINRMVTTQLSIIEDPSWYSVKEIQQVLQMIKAANLNTGGVNQSVSAYCLVGVVRFLLGYYLILVSKRKKLGNFGGHLVYSIEDTALIPISHPSVWDKDRNYKQLKPDEAKYRSLFLLIDLSKYFYFSYTYDLTESLQNNMLRHNHQNSNSNLNSNFTNQSINNNKPELHIPGIGNKSLYIWNHHLIDPLLGTNGISSEWILPIIHGYFEQIPCSIFGRSLTITLIARRSRFYAGTRYLKRGLNNRGQAANDVELEQILHDRNTGDSKEGQYTSYVQLRASIPLNWSQDLSGVVSRPTIVINKPDPLHLGFRKHIVDLFTRYGGPLLLLSLIKQEEPRPREQILGSRYAEAVSFINQFLPSSHSLDLVAIDYKKIAKNKNDSVVERLSLIGEWAVLRNGIFHSHPSFHSHITSAENTINITPDNIPSSPCNPCNRQRGVVRTNCIDSLDRTNVAQFFIGKVALGYQLFALGMIDKAKIATSSNLTTLLLEIYERMGDGISIQYGGSQMHRTINEDSTFESQRKGVSERPKEMIISLVRHYENTFQDQERQDAMNIFLGLYIPYNHYKININGKPEGFHLWELGSDYYLHHNKPIINQPIIAQPCYSDDHWWKNAIKQFECSITGYDEEKEKEKEKIKIKINNDKDKSTDYDNEINNNNNKEEEKEKINSINQSSNVFFHEIHHSTTLTCFEDLRKTKDPIYTTRELTIADSSDAVKVTENSDESFTEDSNIKGAIGLPLGWSSTLKLPLTRWFRRRHEDTSKKNDLENIITSHNERSPQSKKSKTLAGNLLNKYKRPHFHDSTQDEITYYDHVNFLTSKDLIVPDSDDKLPSSFRGSQDYKNIFDKFAKVITVEDMFLYQDNKYKLPKDIVLHEKAFGDYVAYMSSSR